MPIIDDLLERAEERIKKSRHVDLWRQSDARVNAQELLEEVIGREITSEDLDDEVTGSQARRFEKMVGRRVAGEPVAFIVGYTEFRDMRLAVRPGVFVPRNSSELTVDKAVKRLGRKPSAVVVDVATGTGPVALAVAKEVPRARVYGLDIWKPSIEVARSNAKVHKLRNVSFLVSDMLAKLPSSLAGKVDLFTIHPPYVAKSALSTLPREIKDYEPAVSLSDNSDDGLGLVRRLAGEAPQWLRRGGWIMVEVSPDLSRRVRGILIRSGFKEVKSERDSLGATRVVTGRL